MQRTLRLLTLVFLLISQSSYVPIQRSQLASIDWKKAGDESQQLLADYLRVDTTNPPGNERRAADFFARILQKEGIEYKILEASPGRANLYARLKGTGRKRPLILLNHTDVVPVDKKFWSADPYGGIERDGFLWGRGALDMKSLGAAQFMAMLLLKRSGVVLDRDVIFLATADEEAGGQEGAGWFVANHANLIRDAEFAITEGSSNAVAGSNVLYWGIGVTEKTPCWLRLTARGTPGHGSVPRENSAPSKLIRALGKIESYKTRLIATPAVARFFNATAEYQTEPAMKRAHQDVSAALADENLRNVISRSPVNVALLRNTVQPTVVNIGSKTNVIPAIATAEIDCRLLPGQRVEDFVAEIKRVIDDPSIEIETILAFGATESRFDTALVQSIQEVIKGDYPTARFVPTVLAGFTDSHFFRDMGIESYGFSPFLIQASDSGGVHGNDERISVESYRDGTKLLYRIVERFCSARP